MAVGAIHHPPVRQPLALFHVLKGVTTTRTRIGAGANGRRAHEKPKRRGSRWPNVRRAANCKPRRSTRPAPETIYVDIDSTGDLQRSAVDKLDFLYDTEE